MGLVSLRQRTDKPEVVGLGAEGDLTGRIFVGRPLDRGVLVVLVDDVRITGDFRCRYVNVRVGGEDRLRGLRGAVAGGIGGTHEIRIGATRLEV